jgi:enoyl-CoA hydratase/carnithine racemase
MGLSGGGAPHRVRVEPLNERRVRVPETLNARDLCAFDKALHAAFGDPVSRVVVLEGDGTTFCHGLDLVEASETEAADSHVRQFADCLARLATGPKPVIAVVRGAATGSGVGLAAACDLVLAAPGASFALTELLFGVLPAVIGPYLMLRVLPARVRLWALGASTWNAATALEAGLVDRVADDGRLDKEVGSWVRDLARPPADAVRRWKRQVSGPARAAAASSIAVMGDRLRDPVVQGSIRRFVEAGEVPWLATS